MQDYRPSDGRYETDGGSAIPAYPIHMSARDAARFGLLFLHDGRWGDQQIVPPSWVKESTAAWSETPLGSGYGYMWWTSLPGRGFAALDLPAGGFSAIGAGGQFIIVDPADDLVVVHQTRKTTVGVHQMGHLIWLILNAAHAPDVGRDPAAGGG
jgi:CubicO group peptidase (beta-lactamase class C family)